MRNRTLSSSSWTLTGRCCGSTATGMTVIGRCRATVRSYVGGYPTFLTVACLGTIGSWNCTTSWQMILWSCWRRFLPTLAGMLCQCSCGGHASPKNRYPCISLEWPPKEQCSMCLGLWAMAVATSWTPSRYRLISSQLLSYTAWEQVMHVTALHTDWCCADRTLPRE